MPLHAASNSLKHTSISLSRSARITSSLSFFAVSQSGPLIHSTTAFCASRSSSHKTSISVSRKCVPVPDVSPSSPTACRVTGPAGSLPFSRSSQPKLDTTHSIALRLEVCPRTSDRKAASTCCTAASTRCSCRLISLVTVVADRSEATHALRTPRSWSPPRTVSDTSDCSACHLATASSTCFCAARIILRSTASSSSNGSGISPP
mmetsp:Transcript_28437/g.68357  ORF Transcript_28437/g.68357 Transcript_28437/m.68357 type:complete len:205 (-) Transcript_28437:637-1251(-)